MIPITSKYNTVKRQVRITRLQEESVVNHTLIEKMMHEFDVDLSPMIYMESEDDTAKPNLFVVVREAISKMKRWEVVEESYLGLFSFSKFLMWRDLEKNKDAIAGNEIVQHLSNSTNEPFNDRGERISS